MISTHFEQLILNRSQVRLRLGLRLLCLGEPRFSRLASFQDLFVFLCRHTLRRADLLQHLLDVSKLTFESFDGLVLAAHVLSERPHLFVFKLQLTIELRKLRCVVFGLLGIRRLRLRRLSRGGRRVLLLEHNGLFTRFSHLFRGLHGLFVRVIKYKPNYKRTTLEDVAVHKRALLDLFGLIKRPVATPQINNPIDAILPGDLRMLPGDGVTSRTNIARFMTPNHHHWRIRPNGHHQLFPSVCTINQLSHDARLPSNLLRSVTINDVKLPINGSAVERPKSVGPHLILSSPMPSRPCATSDKIDYVNLRIWVHAPVRT